MVTQDGFELSEFDESCINKDALELAVLRKHAANKQAAEEKAARNKVDEEEAAQEVLNMVRKYLPSCQSVDWDITGGLTDTGRSHYFHGPRSGIGDEFDHEVSLDLALRMEHKNPLDPEDEEDFDSAIGFEYCESQVWDAGNTKVSFEFAKEKPDILRISFGDWKVLPITKDQFTDMFSELLDYICTGDEFTLTCAFEAFRDKLDGKVQKGQIAFAPTAATPDQGL